MSKSGKKDLEARSRTEHQWSIPKQPVVAVAVVGVVDRLYRGELNCAVKVSKRKPLLGATASTQVPMSLSSTACRWPRLMIVIRRCIPVLIVKCICFVLLLHHKPARRSQE